MSIIAKESVDQNGNNRSFHPFLIRSIIHFFHATRPVYTNVFVSDKSQELLS